MKMKKRLFLYACLLFPLGMSGQAPSEIRFVNEGEMWVASNGVTTLYVPNSMLMLPGAEITQSGRTNLDGDFLHNASGNVFTTDYSNLLGITGVFAFSGKNYTQRITSTLPSYDPQDGPAASGMMDRKNMYLSFPNVEIANHVAITPQMGVSTNNLLFNDANLLLQSDDNAGNNGAVWSKSKDQDASLLVYGTVSGYGTGGDDGYMEIERTVKANFGKSVTASSNRIGFSAPLSNMYLDYFSDHWVYDPMAKKFLTARNTQFVPGKGYFVFVREQSGQPDHPEDNVDDDLHIQHTTFLFARNYYEDFLTRYASVIPSADQIKPQEKLVTTSVPVEMTAGDNYLGNPYTCAIDVATLFTSWGETWSTLSPVIRMKKEVDVWDGQASNFLAITPDMSQLDEGEKVIASQQLFVVNNTQGATSSLSIPANARTHNALRFLKNTAASYNNEIMLEARESRLGTYGRLVAGFRSWSTDRGDDPSDASFLPSQSGLSPMLYTTATDGKQLAISSLPNGTPYLDISFIAADSLKGERTYQIKATRQESLQTESALLIDKLTGVEQNLFEYPEYEFTAQAGDSRDRFRIVFSPSAITNIDGNEVTPRKIYAYNHQLHLIDFTDSDAGRDFRIYNTTGILVYQNKINHAGANVYDLNLIPGIYIVNYETMNVKISVR